MRREKNKEDKLEGATHTLGQIFVCPRVCLVSCDRSVGESQQLVSEQGWGSKAALAPILTPRGGWSSHGRETQRRRRQGVVIGKVEVDDYRWEGGSEVRWQESHQDRRSEEYEPRSQVCACLHVESASCLESSLRPSARLYEDPLQWSRLRVSTRRSSSSI
jgi:hypothetical protein